MTVAQRPRQQELPIPNTWGGRRRGAGRKPGPRPIVLHRARPAHAGEHPVHVTLRAARQAPNLRHAQVFPVVREATRLASGDDFRVCHFSVQRDHVHLIVEARDRAALSRGMRGLVIRIAKGINSALGRRRGRIWGDRYHVRPLATPREVRNALAYVLLNHRKHGTTPRVLDRCSSAAWFDGWRDARVFPPSGVVCPVAPPRTWLLERGWRRHRLIGLEEAPGTRLA